MARPRSRKLNPSTGLESDQQHFWSSLEGAATVRQIATFNELVTCDERSLVSEAMKKASDGDFDHLPVWRNKDDTFVGLFNRTDHRNADSHERVGTVMERVAPTNLISADAPLLRFVETADGRRCRLVLDGTKVTGLVTLSDLQKIPVRCVLFSLVTHFELLLTERLLRQLRSDESLFRMIPDERRRLMAERKWKRMLEGNMSITPFYALSLHDKMNLWIAQQPNGSVQQKIEPLYKLRNGLAHASNYADTEGTAKNTARLVRDLRTWIRVLEEQSVRITR